MQAMESVKANDKYINAQVDANVMIARTMDSKKSHLNMGNNQTTYVSQAGTFVHHPITAQDVLYHGQHL
jgi:hypothetical protein